jgi:hypothetical protein
MPFTIPPFIYNSAVVVGALSLLGLLIRQVGPWRSQITQAEERLRVELTAQVHEERDARMAADSRIEAMERKLTRQQIRHNAERALDRHRLNNINACFDATLVLLEMNPDRAVEVVQKVKEMRAAQMLAEAEEKAIIRAAEIKADHQEEDHDGN